ncbi:MAG: hypothetical protein KAY02_03470 [Acidovorax sp.]|nr:hypothetical protein [Acidovorax sp.]
MKQRCDAVDAQTLLVVPEGVAVGNVGTVSEQAKALVAHAVQQLVLHLLVAEVVEVLEDQNAHHHLGGVWRAPALGSVTSGQQFIDDLRQVGEVNVPGNDLQRITQRFDLVLACCIGKEVKLDGAADLGLAHRVIVALAGAVSVEGMGFLEVPQTKGKVLQDFPAVTVRHHGSLRYS